MLSSSYRASGAAGPRSPRPGRGPQYRLHVPRWRLPRNWCNCAMLLTISCYSGQSVHGAAAWWWRNVARAERVGAAPERGRPGPGPKGSRPEGESYRLAGRPFGGP